MTALIASKPRKALPRHAEAIRGPDLAALDRVLTETAREMAPMISRTGSVRERMAAELKVLEADLEAVHARRQLVERHYQALSNAFNAEEADIASAMQAYRNGLLDGAEHQERAA